jgi:hypothetical protein
VEYPCILACKKKKSKGGRLFFVVVNLLLEKGFEGLSNEFSTVLEGEGNHSVMTASDRYSGT